MFTDVNDNLAENQLITSTAATTNIRDLGIATPGDVGSVRCKAFATGTFAGLSGANSVTFNLQDCATEGGTYETKGQGQSQVYNVEGNLVAGTVLYDATLPRSDLQRFVRGHFEVAGTASGATSTVSCVLTPAIG